jgi:carboxymethylenebutenolidase
LKGQFQTGSNPTRPRGCFRDRPTRKSHRAAADLVAKARAIGGDIQFQLYPDATHGFDDPSPSHQSDAANASATRDAIPRAIAFFASVLKP